MSGNKMEAKASRLGKRKREVQNHDNEMIENSISGFKNSPTIAACGLGMSSKKPKAVRRALSDTFNKNKISPTVASKSGNGLKRTLQRKMSMNIRRQKLKTLQDYSLPRIDASRLGMKRATRSLTKLLSPSFSKQPSESSRGEDHDLQQKIDHEIKMRDGIAKLLVACKHPSQMLEAAKNLLTSNTRILSYMTELQQRKTDEVLGKSKKSLGNQLPCKATVSISDMRIPLMWKDTDHFKNKGDYRRYCVFCLLRIGSDIYDTAMMNNVDRSMTDITFDDIVVFKSVAHDFRCQVEVYCHKLHEDLTIASTPKKLRKKINNFSGSVGRSVGKRLSGLKDDSDILGNMVLGPKFELVASGTLRLGDIEDTISTYDFISDSVADASSSELPLFGHYCCRLAAVPQCLVEPAVDGYLSLQEDDELGKWKRYWCVLKNLQLACWSSPMDVEVTQPLFTIAVTKNTQISDADPSICQHNHTFHLTTNNHQSFVSEHSLACDTKDDLNRWWDGFQQHLLDQAFWKHTCENVMALKKGTPRHKPVFLRKGSLYEETPIRERVARSQSETTTDGIGMDESHLSKMLNTLMGEAQQIRGESTHTSVFK